MESGAAPAYVSVYPLPSRTLRRDRWGRRGYDTSAPRPGPRTHARDAEMHKPCYVGLAVRAASARWCGPTEYAGGWRRRGSLGGDLP
jgi:hypothetical protein